MYFISNTNIFFPKTTTLSYKKILEKKYITGLTLNLNKLAYPKKSKTNYAVLKTNEKQGTLLYLASLLRTTMQSA